MQTPKSMQKLEELFHEAAGLEPQERADFMARVRSSQPELAAAVESLIAALERPDSPIDVPAFEAAAEMFADEPPALVAGQVVGHYQIVAPLGKGGMGEVYLANDAKLDRKSRSQAAARGVYQSQRALAPFYPGSKDRFLSQSPKHHHDSRN